MTALTNTIAMDIVERTMKIMDYNINVMNEYGVIIGTGAKKRLGQIHEGALQVLKENRRIDIRKEEKNHYAGTQPGINLPILFEDSIVGVIGVSGEPNEINQYGELVKMGAELTLKQAALTEQLQWDERLREELVHEIINNKIDQYSYERMQRMGINLEITRLPVLITFESDGMSEKAVAKQKQSGLKLLRARMVHDDLIASVDRDKLIILKVHAEYQNRSAFLGNLTDILNQLRLRTKSEWYAGIGMTFSLMKDANKAYQAAYDAFKVGNVLYPNHRILLYEELNLPVLMSRLDWGRTDMTTAYQRLREYDRNEVLQKTLRVYIEENMEQAIIAEKLFIHRNTLRYRLEKIKEITGKDPRNIHDLFTLYASQLAFQLDL